MLILLCYLLTYFIISELTDDNQSVSFAYHLVHYRQPHVGVSGHLQDRGRV